MKHLTLKFLTIEINCVSVSETRIKIKNEIPNNFKK